MDDSNPGKTITEADIGLQERDNIHRIATYLGEHSLGQDEPCLDPESSEFDHYRWAEAATSRLCREGITLQEQGIIFSNLRVSGSESALQLQETVLSSFTVPFRILVQSMFGCSHVGRRRILHGFDGVLQSGELLLVLGRPGSGCSTFLKTLCGHLSGLTLEPESTIHYRGIGFEKMTKQYRGEVAYNQEVDEHFPHLTVGETLSFAASARVPQLRPSSLTRSRYVETIVKVVMAIFGLSHATNTKVGDNFFRGVSGGERKRVSIAEMFLSRVRIGAWDNSTRGLDSASALQVIKSLRLSADLSKSCHAVAAYQTSQPMYDLFDKVILLYSGYEIFYGPRQRAIEYFEEMGWYHDPARVDADFLTALTNPDERHARAGMEEKVPRTPAEFWEYWKQSKDYKELVSQIEDYESQYPIDGKDAEDFHNSHTDQQARHSRQSSPYLLSIPMQIRLCLKRAFQNMRNNVPTVMSTVISQVALSLIIGSIFFNTPNTNSAFFQKGAVLFFAILMNAMITVNEVMQLYSQRPVVEKQARYAFVHPFAEAIASTLSDLPVKMARCSIFSVVLYFMANLYREPGQFFVFYLFLITAVLALSSIFRTFATITRTIGQAMGLAGILILSILVYTGFTLPQTYMHPWLSWIRWINPIYYAFEALVANEFHGREFQCTSFVPPYGEGNSSVCASIGAVPGQEFVQGDEFIEKNYNYHHSHLWRNYGILLAFTIAFHCVYFTASEFCRFGRSKAEALVFRPGHVPKGFMNDDVEGQVNPVSSDVSPGVGCVMNLPKQKDILMWKGLNYDIPVKGGTIRLLNDVNGWVKPGTLTALMGVSGAGKTTLLDVLAQRTSIGTVTGDIFVNGRLPGASFPRRTGYVQQQDLHLETTTVREALQFSAILRQPRSTPKAEKIQYVEEVIQLLGMEHFTEAIVGQLGEGLNVEQRKLLSIGVELAAKPTLLIFLDEPTSGLDSQSSWTICTLLRRLADNGQAVLATIHQPSALLFQIFDRLLFMAKGGKTVYFGQIGSHSSVILNYFYRNGAPQCEASENPAEYILRMVSGDKVNIDWPAKWNESPELQEVIAELGRLEGLRDQTDNEAFVAEFDGYFALPLYSQFRYVAIRAFQQYFRQPEYIFSKFCLGIASGLFIGFSFWKVDYSEQGFQNALFSVFLLCSIFSILVNQIMPKFVSQRSLYEVRERPSRVYSWQVFIMSQVLVEVPWQALLGVCVWASAFFPVFGTQGSSECKGLVLLFIVQFYIYAGSMAQMVVSALDNPAMGAQIATLMFGLCFVFNGVMQPPDALPGFWIFMYHLSPFTYYVAGIAAAALGGRPVQCSDVELNIVDPPAGQTCGEYLAKFVEMSGGSLYNKDASSACEYCTMSSADQYLAGRRIHWDDRWRNYGIFVCYFAFNAFLTISLYYLFRVRRWRSPKA